MAVTDLLAQWRSDPQFMNKVAAWRVLPEQPAVYASTPSSLHPVLQRALVACGVERLYAHQRDAIEAALQQESLVIATPTASGKTLCYNLPVLHTLLTDAAACALYLFPTKALAHDQWAELNRLAKAVEAVDSAHPLTSSIAAYDGDTPSAQRGQIRKQARLLLTNPDMLHISLLPNHAQWADFLAGLRWVVIDEMHTYRGVFGSHVANVLRRLQRICRHYGAAPRFICTSATIANPVQLAERLTEQRVHLIERSTAPRGEKHILLLNTPLVDAEKGVRRAAVLEAADLAAQCVDAGLQTIVFGRSRVATELLLTYLRSALERRRSRGAQRYALGEEAAAPKQRLDVAEHVQGYRGGYLPAERRSIEEGLRSGRVRAVVATNALELGIDIGGLAAAIVCGYPGGIAATWQQFGRAGRTTEAAVAVLVATAGLLDQYVIRHSEFLFEQSPEHALIHPDNLMLLVDHVRCAAAELPFHQEEAFGASPYLRDVLALLAEQGEVQRHGERFFWSGLRHPAREVGLRSVGGDPVLIQRVGPSPEREKSAPCVLGEVDQASAQLLVHEGAIYLHGGQSYLVQRLDLTALRADATAVDVDYYTEAISDAEVELLACHAVRSAGGSLAAWGDVAVHTQVIGYRKIKRTTHETLGVYPLDYARRTLETNAYWCEIAPAVQQALEAAGLWFDSVNDYGPNWEEQRAIVRARARGRCAICGAPESPGRQHDVHHKIPFRLFGYAPGLNDLYLEANRLENLLLVCRGCHRRIETAGRYQTGLDGLAYLLSNLAPLHLMCDPGDLGVHVARGDPIGRAEAFDARARAPRVYLYERAPAGLGFSALLYDLHETLLEAALESVRSCACAHGCPACVGPVLDDQPLQLQTKRLTLALLEQLVV
ncbi:DEAD/DEAH box helicase [Caldilinea sp.]|uniref:DEAD/DEAH box helicase n=1 Tax=Caldilinea sp. TaxID=2293560 RepID=UPI0021DC6B74|nr:DEAD/DEAH box helicase [Caldilinea sp.]GIV70013.1 MAG: putative ATP-dependent helicase YprA [Caldilinea sp.]